MPVRYRQLTLADIPAAMRLKDAAGWNQTESDWRRFLLAGADGCFAAESDGRLIGTATTIIYEGRFAWIGMVIVNEGFRGQGIGTELLDRAIQHLDARGVPCMKLDATPQGRPLYEKFGFVAEYEIERWEMKRPEAVHRSACASVEVRENIDEVLEMDREIFGADRSALLRSLGDAAPEFTLVAGEDAEISAYAFGRHGSRADHMGPWVARSESAAAKLLDEFLRRSSRELVFVDCVRLNRLAISLVRVRGFTFSRSLTRMFRGANEHPGRPELVCAILGPEFG